MAGSLVIKVDVLKVLLASVGHPLSHNCTVLQPDVVDLVQYLSGVAQPLRLHNIVDPLSLSVKVYQYTV